MLRFYGKNQLVGIAATSTLNSDVYTTSGANSFHEADRCQGIASFRVREAVAVHPFAAFLALYGC
jgi:hypothetical protein